MRGYVFLLQRPIDREPWPVVYTDRELAEKAQARAGPIVTVELSLGAVTAALRPELQQGDDLDLLRVVGEQIEAQGFLDHATALADLARRLPLMGGTDRAEIERLRKAPDVAQ